MTPAVPSLKAPFPWYGGKSRAAPLIWQALGDVPNFVSPFFGSGAELWGRPHPPRVETVNDKDAFVCNVFRALQADPEAVAQWSDFPVNEAQQHAVHTWLVGQRETFTARLMGDPDYYDAQVAGRWLYGIACWIGSGWCAGHGAWHSVEDEEGYRQLAHAPTDGAGIGRQNVHLGDAGKGVHRQRVHLSDAGQGVAKVSLGDDGLRAWFAALQARLTRVRVCCGDWTRVLGPSVTFLHGLTGILFDPPYALEEDRDMRLYREDSGTVAHDVRAWCLEHGTHPLLRIVLCGYSDTHDALLTHGWRKAHWAAQGGYGNQGHGRGRANAARESLWLSPQCLRLESEQQLPLFTQRSPCVPNGPDYV